METIIELNNLAVTCIDAKSNFNEAVRSLGWALQLTKNQFQMMIPPSSSSSHEPCDEASIRQNEATTGPGTPCDMMMTSTITVVNNDNNHADHRMMGRQPFFQSSSAIKYQHPFTIFPEMRHATQSFSSQYSCSTTTMPCESMIAEAQTTRAIGLSMIIIFNLALCFDLMASSSSSSSSNKRTKQKEFTGKAISLYEKVVELYIQSKMESNVVDDMVEDRQAHSYGYSRMVLRAQQDVVVLAAVNNLIELYQDESSSVTKKYVHLMMVLFQEIQRTDYECDEIQTVVTSQARVFLSNAVVASSNMRLSLSLSAAAA